MGTLLAPIVILKTGQITVGLKMGVQHSVHLLGRLVTPITLACPGNDGETFDIARQLQSASINFS